MRVPNSYDTSGLRRRLPAMTELPPGARRAQAFGEEALDPPITCELPSRLCPDCAHLDPARSTGQGARSLDSQGFSGHGPTGSPLPIPLKVAARG